MKQGDIVLVPFPYTDLSAIKTRPALIISKDELGEDVILLGITSKKGLFSFEIFEENLKKGQLPKSSFVKINKVVTLKKTIVRKRVAILKDAVCGEIAGKFKAQF
ncbi:MAG: type II toxin-antitoxin system PemK/MazF family toxin [bacterium]|nr:type II toxin-antitoxin system PemK/MazF family toxin [bacterium]